MLTVLLIEDSIDDAQLVERALADTEFEIDLVLSAQGALNYLSANRPYEILLDLRLPNGEGIELVKRIHEAAGGVPVILMPGQDEEGIIREVTTLGIKGYISKSEMTQDSFREKLLAQMLLAAQSRLGTWSDDDTANLQKIEALIQKAKAANP